jgi:hypothetical protein
MVSASLPVLLAVYSAVLATYAWNVILLQAGMVNVCSGGFLIFHT